MKKKSNKKLFIKKILLIMTVAMLCFVGLYGCGEEEDTTQHLDFSKDSDLAYLNGLEDGQYYVRHKNNTFEPIYFNKATFDYGSVASSSNTNRILWFKEDYDKIPTFDSNNGDTIVMYTTSELDERFILERFKDLGISIGWCKLTPTSSGKYTLNTNPDARTSYPESDADEIINFQNGVVILDKLQEVKARNKESLKLNEEQNVDYASTLKISEYGTVEDLKTNAYYNAEVYSGTQRSQMTLQANVHILGSCDVIKNLNYHFTDDYLLQVELPEDLITGYYMLNAVGVFRYIGNGDTYTAKTDYNKNIFTEEEKQKLAEAEEAKNKNEELNTTNGPKQIVVASDSVTLENTPEPSDDDIQVPTTAEDIKTEVFNVQNAVGKRLRFMIIFDGADASLLDGVTAMIQHPDGYYIETEKTYDGNLYADVNIDVDGEYKIIVKNANGLTVNVEGKILEDETEDQMISE